MQQSKGKFWAYGITLAVVGLAYMFLYSGLQNDQINIIQTFSAWDKTATQLPMTIGNFVCIALAFVFGTCFIKFGVRKTIIPIILIAAIGCVGIAAADGLACNNGSGNFGLFWVSLFAVRCTAMVFQVGAFMLVANWFIRYRGQLMGVITMGTTLFTVLGTSVSTSIIQNNLGGDYRPFYIGLAVLICVLAVVTALFLKDKPEDAGLYPDGLQTPPKSEAGDDIELTVREVLKRKEAWQLIGSFGSFMFVINAAMGSMAVYYISLGSGNGDPSVWLSALKWLSLGALLGLPMHYFFGFIDDKIGSVKAALLVGIGCIIPVVGLMLQPAGGSEPLMVLWGFGVATMTGGVPTIHPCITAFAFGRREYQSANRIVLTIQMIPSAVAAMMMTIFIQGGHAFIGYIVLLVIAGIGIASTLSMLGLKDKNEADRMYASKK